MKDKTDEEAEKAAQFIADFPLIIREIFDECIKQGVVIDVIGDNVDELALMTDACIDEEIKLCNEIAGRSPTREEIISVLADRIIKYAEQKQKFKE